MNIGTNSELINWLLDGDPWVEYRTRLDLLDEPEDDAKVIGAYRETLSNPQITNLVHELAEWPGPVLKSHKKAGHFLHKLGFLADIGLKADTPGVEKTINRILGNHSVEGPFQVLVNINPRYGGSGTDELAWMLCDAPSVTYAMAKFGLGELPEIQDSLNYLNHLVKENGWPCAVSPAAGKFRGPGRKTDPCPYANLVMLKLLSQFPELHSEPFVKTGVETILSLWEQRKERRPYLFAMGTDFCKLKAPLIWYDVLHVTDVLTHFHWALSDKRLLEMVNIINKKLTLDGRLTAESIWMDWKKWEFGQKKEPSRWITFIAHRIMKRLGMV